jgi:acyl-CoA dehydrogenase
MRSACAARAARASCSRDRAIPGKCCPRLIRRSTPARCCRSHTSPGAACGRASAGAVDRARAFLRNARRAGGQTPPGAAHLIRATASLQTLRALVATSLQRYEAAAERPDDLDSLAFQTAMSLLKVNASETAHVTVMSAFQACGLAGYRNDGEFSISRALRDVLSASIMINNDRILANAAAAPLLMEVPALLRD